MAITQIRDIAYTKKAPFNHYNLWLHLNDKKRLILEMFFNGKWTEIGKFGENVIEVGNNNSIIELLNTLTNNNIDVTTLTLNGTIEDTTYYAEGTYDSESNTITLLRNGWMYVFSIDPETYEISISNKVNLNDEDLYFIVGDTEEIKTHNVNEFKKVKRESSLVRPSYQARAFRLKYSEGTILQGIGDVPTETSNMYLEVSAYSIKLGMKIFRMYSNGTIIETPDEFANNIDTRFILKSSYIGTTVVNFDYNNTNEIIIDYENHSSNKHKKSYIKDIEFTDYNTHNRCILYTSPACSLEGNIERESKVENLRYGYNHLIYNTITHTFSEYSRVFPKIYFGYIPVNENSPEMLWVSIMAIELTRYMIQAQEAGQSAEAEFYKSIAIEYINNIRRACSTVEHPIPDIMGISTVADTMAALCDCFGGVFSRNG